MSRIRDLRSRIRLKAAVSFDQNHPFIELIAEKTPDEDEDL
jgi:hypothetical protein